MKTVKLTEEERRVILRSLSVEYICESYCYCGYDEDLCEKVNSTNSEPACRLKQVIESIGKKLS